MLLPVYLSAILREATAAATGLHCMAICICLGMERCVWLVGSSRSGCVVSFLSLIIRRALCIQPQVAPNCAQLFWSCLHMLRAYVNTGS